MSETREQYREQCRERLGEINLDASMYGEHENDADGNAFMTRDCFEKGAMAVAAQALRDARDRMRSIERDMGSKAWAAGWAADEIEDLAQEIGIDL